MQCEMGTGWFREGFVLDKRKQAISIRLGASDVRNIKRLAQRLGVRESDVIRFAIKSMLNRISPLCDEGITGRNLLPVLVESGDELIRHFELDAYRLDGIINDRAREDARVDRDDIALLAMSGLREQYLVMRLHGNGSPVEADIPKHSLRMYLYDKYIYRNEEGKSGEPREAAVTEFPVGVPCPAA
jgi:Arc/MetJ-type ribon-helix-helix transcriptional regulator